jgi:hypothetical protein
MTSPQIKLYNIDKCPIECMFVFKEALYVA